MSKQEFLRDLAELLNEPQDQLRPDLELDGLPGWDSTGIMSVVSLLADVLGAAPDVSRLRACRSVGDIVALTEGKLI
jgi:acyl carrier protein